MRENVKILILIFRRRSFSSAMSTDTDGANEELEQEEEIEVEIKETSAGKMNAPLSTMLITANVGSIFEDADRLVPQWRSEVVRKIGLEAPQFVAVHFQEVSKLFFSLPRFYNE